MNNHDDRSGAIGRGAGEGRDAVSSADAHRIETEQDLQATSDAIKADIGRLAALEDEKMVLAPEDPRVDAVSDEAVALADRIGRETRIERELSGELR